MDKKNDKEVSELLRQLKDFVEKNNESSPSFEDPRGSIEDSTEDLLSKLQETVGAVSATSDSEGDVKDAYDISGYEIIEDEAGEFDNEAEVGLDVAEAKSPSLQETVEVEVSDAFGIDVVSEEDDLPAGENNIVQTEVYDELSSESDFVEPIENEKDLEVRSEAEVSAVRERVETFVQNTLTPDEEIDIFQSIVPRKEMSEESVLQEVTQKTDTTEDCASSAVNELPFEDEVEPEEIPQDYVETPMLSRFFKRDTADMYEDAVEDLSFDYKEFNDGDINLALALGSEEELESAFGFSRVRAAQNGFRDPAEETMVSSSVYAGDGKEYRSYDKTDEIKGRYKKEKRYLYKRVALTFLLSIFTLFFEHIFLTKLSIPYVTELFSNSVVFHLTSIVLTLLLVLCSYRKIGSGFLSVFAMKSDIYTPISCFAVLNLIYEFLAIFVYSDSMLLSYNFVLSVFLLFAMTDEYMRLMRESATFDLISNKTPKLSLERYEGEKEQRKDGSYLGRHDFFVEKVNFVGNYFSRVGRIPMRQSLYTISFVIVLFLGLIMMLVSGYTSGSLPNAFRTLFFFLMLCAPIQYLIAGTYPFYHLSKGLRKHQSAILNEAIIDEYATTDTIYLSDDEMFGKHGASVVGVRLYDNIEFYTLLYYAHAVFSKVGAPLAHVFDTSSREIPKPQEVKINEVAAGGLEATVDGTHKVLVGTMAFVRSQGFFPKRNIDDEKKIESGQCSILYVAVDGVLSAKLYIKYSITKRFEKFVDEMVENDILVGIRSLDPSVNERMLAILRENKDPQIRVIRPTANEFVSIGKHSDSAIITERNSHMIFRILQQCFHIRKIHKKQVLIRLISAVLGATLVAALMLTDTFGLIPSVAIALYHLLWMIFTLIYTRTKLK